MPGRVADTDSIIAQGLDLGKRGAFADAEATFRRAIALEPENGRAHHALGLALHALQRYGEAVEAHERAVALAPRVPEAHHEFGRALLRLNRAAEAAEAAGRAVQLDPARPEPHGLLARALLVSGDFKRGWAEYEWRWKCAGMDPRRAMSVPQWTGGEKVAGRTILLHHEQGFGDTIQFSRYAPLIAQRGADVIVQVPRNLTGLMKRLPGGPDVISTDDPTPAGVHLHAPLMSLPLAFNTTLRSIPATVPYLSAAPQAAAVWSGRVKEAETLLPAASAPSSAPSRAATGAPALRVGIAWAGRPTHADDRLRSIPLAALAPLSAAAAGAAFYSLQKGAAAAEARTPPAGMRLIDFSDRLFDFSDAAALIANLDLVITVDTAVAHLAGAMGRRVWVLLPFSPDFRWLLDRPDSPWYPTMRLFRQPAQGQWRPAIEAVATELRTAATAALAAAATAAAAPASDAPSVP